MAAMPATATQPLTVSQATAQLKAVVEQVFPDVWVAGEVSNFSRPASGHCYLTLKDEHAQMRAVAWRGVASRLKFDLKDGMQLVCHGRLDLYAPRGSYQLVIDQAQPDGLGGLELALQQLKEKLAAEGLFAIERKQPLPPFPRRVGFVTSPTGAAVRDFLEVARRRWQGVEVLVIPARVQGDGAAAEIAAGIKLAQKIRPKLDALVIGRGGGSIEDLWSFNVEVVVRAIAACTIPTVSAVGHEIDVTLADLAADLRAATPTEAAERVVPAGDEASRRIAALGDRMTRTVRGRISLARDRLEGFAARRPLARPYAITQDAARRLDELQTSLDRSMRTVVQDRRGQLERLAGKADSLSPLGVLARGYSITTDARGRVVRSADTLVEGDTVTLQFSHGRASSKISQIDSA